ncbi:MAG: hypothetical protein CL927_06685 [Deltaproteobacteria bacterium]|nr:hypothetical protein [Deltaproteobacteria bacterium]HCH61370.1 hypothetical protein [Deltaproteobacteria bacterium]
MSVTEELIALLQAGDIDGFNEKRRGKGRIEAFAPDLSGLQLVGADLSGMVLEKADLSGSNLTDTILARTDLSGADLSQTNLTGAMAIQLKLRDAWVEDTIFDEADLSQSDLSDAEFHRCSFKETILTKARLKRSNFVECRFDSVDAAEARFSGSTTEKCRFVQGHFRETSFKGVALPGADLTGSDFTQAKFREADLSGANLSAAQFPHADLKGAKLDGATVEDTDFRRADLTEASLEGADLEESILTEAEVPAQLQPLAWIHAPDLGPPLLQDARWASNGTHLAAVWTDTDADSRAWMRAGVAPIDSQGIVEAPILPVPGDLVLASGITATDEGFSVMVLVERASGPATWVFRLNVEGRLVRALRSDLPYRPMVRPLLLPGKDGAIDIYGIGGQGPVISVLQVDVEGEMSNRHSAVARTARGFASDHHPVLLTKGGTLELIVPGKGGRAVSCPGEFPGQGCGAVPIDPNDPTRGLVLTWIPSSGRGVSVATCVPGTPPMPQTFLRKLSIGRIDASICGAGAWAVFTCPDVDNPRKMAAWSLSLPDGKPTQLSSPAGRVARSVQMVPNTFTPIAVVTWDDGSATVFRLTAKGGNVAWTV